MATITRTNVSIDISALKTFFEGLSIGLITVTQTNNTLSINVDNEATILFDFTNNVISVDSVTQMTLDVSNTPYSITVCYLGTMLFYVQLRDTYGRRFVFIYEKIGGHKLLGFDGSGSASASNFYDISDISLTDVDSSLVFLHGIRLNIINEPGYISYADEALFCNNVKSLIDPIFISCSSVIADRILTFNGKNYYSIGANTLLLAENL